MILFCNCGWSDVIDGDVKRAVFGALEASGANFAGVDDLCRLAGEGDERLEKWASDENLVVVACYRRSIEALFARAGLTLSPKAKVFNMRQTGADEIIKELKDISPGEAASDVSIERRGNWVPWFPVIDYGRCINCKQCLNFCLFGVYTLDSDGRVKVERPGNCKTNCPACARVCPEAAIIFPKYADSPINGDEVDEEALKNADKSKALADLMEGDVHEIIRSRSKQKKRFAALKDIDKENLSDEQKAAKLSELQEKLDIPQDVLDSLSGGKCPNSAFCDKDCKS